MATGSPRQGSTDASFFNVGLAGAILLALTGCATFRGSKSDLDKATTDLRNLLEGFKGDGARQARLASIGQRIENRCREVIELKTDFTRRVDALSRQRETPSAELTALVDEAVSEGRTIAAAITGTVPSVSTVSSQTALLAGANGQIALDIGEARINNGVTDLVGRNIIAAMVPSGWHFTGRSLILISSWT